MKKLTKVELLSQIENVQNNFILGLSAISVLSEPFAVAHLQKSNCVFGKHVVDFHQVASLLVNVTDRNSALKEFTTMLIRGLIKESYEVVNAYTKSTQQREEFRKQPWFQFYRLIRNCVSHNFHFDFRKSDKKMLPVSWRGKIIDSSLDQQSLDISFLGYDGVWELFSDLKSFVNEQLK